MCVHVRNIMFALLLQQMSWQIKYTQYRLGAICFCMINEILLVETHDSAWKV